MSLYYPGYNEAIEKVKKMNDIQLLDHIGNLFGNTDLPEDWTHEDLLHEAIMQTKKDFTDIHSKEYEQVNFWTGLIKLQK